MKKIIFVLLASLAVLSMASCGEKAESSNAFIEQSYEDTSSWKKSLLAKAGLAEIAEPEGEKVFTEDENGNFKFTMTPADSSSLNGMAQSFKSKAAHFADDISHSPIPNESGAETEFTMSYTLNNKKVSIKMSLENSMLTVEFTFE